MKVINISDSRNRNTHVALETRRARPCHRYVDSQSHRVNSARFIKGTLETGLERLTRETSLEELSQRLVDGDPEIDIELFGRRIGDSSRIYLNNKNEPAHNVVIKELVYQADGTLKESRELQAQEANINTELPIKWSGKLMPKAPFAKKMAFTGCYQITHVDGLTYDFLYNMARELEEKEAFLFLAAGPKMNEPLILTRNGTPYRAFLEGRTRDDKYMLLMHLTNLELKPVMEASP